MKTIIRDYLKITIEVIKKYHYYFIIVFVVLLSLDLIFPDVGCCGMKLVMGIPCPTCGMTRAFHALLRFDIPKAFYYHPLWWMVPIVGFVIVYHSRPIVGKVFHNWVFWTIIFVSLLTVYIVRFINVAPLPPMELNPNSLRDQIYRFLH